MWLSDKLLGQGYVNERLKSCLRKFYGRYGISYQTIWGPSLPNVTRHSGWWPYTVTPSIDRRLHHFFTITDRDFNAKFTFLPNFARFPYNICDGCGMQTEDAYSSGPLVLSHFGTCMCSNVETNLSWTCLVSGLFCFAHPSVLLFCLNKINLR